MASLRPGDLGPERPLGIGRDCTQRSRKERQGFCLRGRGNKNINQVMSRPGRASQVQGYQHCPNEASRAFVSIPLARLDDTAPNELIENERRGVPS